MPRLQFEDKEYGIVRGETVLETLLRNNVGVNYSCKRGTCLTCLLKTPSVPPKGGQKELSPALAERGLFLPCISEAQDGFVCSRADEAEFSTPAEITRTEVVSKTIQLVRIRPDKPFSYRSGQFINLHRADGLSRSYSLASVARLDDQLEIHVQHRKNGIMSNWLREEAEAGEKILVSGPFGSCFYSIQDRKKPLLLIATGAGLAPLSAIIRDALEAGHAAPIHLYHGSGSLEGVYFRDKMSGLAAQFPNLVYQPCLSGPEEEGDNLRDGRAHDVAMRDIASLKGWRVFLCGNPEMVHEARKQAYLAGAEIHEISFDAFDLKDLRKRPR